MCYECGKFTWIRDTGCFSDREGFDCDHKIYNYSLRKAKGKDFFSLEKGIGFDYIPPVVDRIPEKGSRMREKMLDVLRADNIRVSVKDDKGFTRIGKLDSLPINEDFTDDSSLEVVSY